MKFYHRIRYKLMLGFANEARELARADVETEFLAFARNRGIHIMTKMLKIAG